MARTPQEIADKWARNLGASTADMEAGVRAVREAPTAKAARKVDKMRAGILAAIDSGKWEAGLNSVSLSDWQRAFLEKGVPRVSQGAQAARPKMQQFMTEVLPFQETLKAQLDNMPDLTLQDRINKMVAWTNGMAKFKKS